MTTALHNCTDAGDDTRRAEKWWSSRAEQEIGSDYNSRFHFFAAHSCDISGSILSALINLIRQIIIIYGPTDTCLDFCCRPVRQSGTVSQCVAHDIIPPHTLYPLPGIDLYLSRESHTAIQARFN